MFIGFIHDLSDLYGVYERVCKGIGTRRKLRKSQGNPWPIQVSPRTGEGGIPLDMGPRVARQLRRGRRGGVGAPALLGRSPDFQEEARTSRRAPKTSENFPKCESVEKRKILGRTNQASRKVPKSFWEVLGGSWWGVGPDTPPSSPSESLGFGTPPGRTM